jgi:hypothetical protein
MFRSCDRLRLAHIWGSTRVLYHDTKNQQRVDIDAIPEMMVNKSRIVN